MKGCRLKTNAKKIHALKCVEATVGVPTGIKRTVSDREIIAKMGEWSAEQSLRPAIRPSRLRLPKSRFG